MNPTYPILTPAQLTTHLKSLRKRRKITQAQLGKLIGVGQARMAEIEANPGTVSLEQTMRILHHLGARLSLQVLAQAPPSFNPHRPAPGGPGETGDEADW